MSEVAAPLTVPDRVAWASLGLNCLGELSGGHQSRVFRVERDRQHLVAKLTDRRYADGFARRRLELLRRLSESNDTAVGPVPLGGKLISAIGLWDLVVYPEVMGSVPDITSERDVVAMAESLAALHESMRSLDAGDLPWHAALEATAAMVSEGSEQMLHGDFAPVNMRLTAHGPRVLDFDDCGRGTVDFEIGNTLYMVMFDARMGKSSDTVAGDYDQFRSWFVSAYRTASGLSLPDVELDRAISTRVDALSRWLDDLDSAPVGISSSSAEWQQELRGFVEEYKHNVGNRAGG